MGAKIRSGGRFYVDGHSGQPADGWKVYTFTAGSAGVEGTDDKATYTDYTLGTANANPVILNARGEAEIWWDGTYLIKIYDANDVLIYSLDYYGQGEDPVVDPSVVPLNGSFEIDDNGDGIPDNWTFSAETGATIAKVDDDAVHGVSCLSFTGVSNGGGTATSDKFPVQPGEVRILDFSYKSSAVDTKNKIDVKWYTQAGTLISTDNLYTEGAANPLSFTEKTAIIAVPSTATQAALVITGLDPSGTTLSGTSKFDAIQFKKTALIETPLASAVNFLNYTPAATGNRPDLSQDSNNSEDVGMTLEGLIVKNGVIAYDGALPAGTFQGFRIMLDDDDPQGLATLTSGVWTQIDTSSYSSTTHLKNLANYGAKAAILRVRAVSQTTSGTSAMANVAARKHGSVANDNGQIVAEQYNQRNVAGLITAVAAGEFTVPVDSNGDFDLKITYTGVNLNQHDIALVGFYV